MGLFGGKKSKPGGAAPSPPEVVQIGDSQPAWLPAPMRSAARGEWTFLCPTCDSYPSIKWPSDGGAEAGAAIHLGVDHNTGMMAGMPRQMREWDMVPRGQLA